MADSPITLLRAHARHAPWNARGLAAHVTALVDATGMRPTNASARVAPSARSIRFYVANGLLDRPEGTGTAATYNYRHFLQLLGIKISSGPFSGSLSSPVGGGPTAPVALRTFFSA